MHHPKYPLLAAVITFVVGITVACLTSLFPSVGMSLLTRIDPKIVFRPESILPLCAVGAQDSKQPAFPKMASGAISCREELPAVPPNKRLQRTRLHSRQQLKLNGIARR